MDESDDDVDLGFSESEDDGVAIINDAVPVEMAPDEDNFDVESVIGYRYLNETVIHFSYYKYIIRPS